MDMRSCGEAGERRAALRREHFDRLFHRARAARSARARRRRRARRSPRGSPAPDRRSRASTGTARWRSASASFAGLTSTAKTSAAPSARASWIAETPSPPMPKTATVSPAPDPRLAQRMQRGRRGAHQDRALLERDGVGQRMRVPRRHGDEFREAAVAMLADHLARRAELFAAGAAVGGSRRR